MKRLIILLCFALSGCATVTFTTLERVLNENPNLSPEDAPVKLGLRPVQDNALNDSVRVQVYSVYAFGMGFRRAAVYFKNDKWVEWGEGTPFYNLNMLYKLGLIDGAEYHWRWDRLQQADFQNRQMAIQAYSAYSQAAYQQQELNLQRQQWQLQQDQQLM